VQKICPQTHIKTPTPATKDHFIRLLMIFNAEHKRYYQRRSQKITTKGEHKGSLYMQSIRIKDLWKVETDSIFKNRQLSVSKILSVRKIQWRAVGFFHANVII
jgi:hypothetical protein